MRTRWWLCISSLMLVFLIDASARAQVAAGSEVRSEVGSEVGAQLLGQGEAAYKQGRFGAALDAFEASYRQTGDAHTLFRVGDAADKLGRHARAVEAFRDYLRRVPTTPNRAFVVSRIEANQAAHRDEVQEQKAQMDRVGPRLKGPTALSPRSVAPVAMTSVPKAALEQRRQTEQANQSERSGSSPAGPFWVWAAGGTVAVVGIVVAAVLVGASSSGTTPESIRGNVGGVVQTLGSR